MKQITIPTESRPGQLADITNLLAAMGVNIIDFDAQEQSGHGFIVLRVDHYDVALKALRLAGYQAITEDAIVIRVEDKPGALAEVANRFKEAQMNLRSLHIIRRRAGSIDVSLVSDDNALALSLVDDLLVSA